MSHQMLADMAQIPDKIGRYDFQTGPASEPRDIEATMLPVNDKSGAVTGRLVVLRDISEEKSMERFREELTNMIVHDLRSPLSGVISSLRLIEDMVADNDLTGFEQVLGIAITSSENQMRMIESMLEMDKLEHGHLPLHISVASLEPLVRKAIAALEVLAVGAKVHLVDCVPADLPPLIMDDELIRRVLVNLMDNALRHTPAEGEVRVEASVIEGRGEAKIGVLDTGKGIPPEFRDRIFDKFVQIPKSALRGQRGIGLGLTFCRLAVEAHGGQIWVDSAPSGGAAFWFTLPLAQRAEHA
jgi:NtrC-family two-component system sensor histidine kinase KinB